MPFSSCCCGFLAVADEFIKLCFYKASKGLWFFTISIEIGNTNSCFPLKRKELCHIELLPLGHIEKNRKSYRENNYGCEIQLFIFSRLWKTAFKKYALYLINIFLYFITLHIIKVCISAFPQSYKYVYLLFFSHTQMCICFSFAIHVCISASP